MASYSMDKCCIMGVKHEGHATGEFKEVGGIKSYVTYTKDKSTKNAILYMADAFGVEAINAHLIADQFAANGYFTVIPDLFQGDPVPLDPPAGIPADFDLWAWLKGPPSKEQDTVDPIVVKVIRALREEYNVENLGTVGYCFGGKYVVRFLGETGSRNNAMCDAGFTAHPSLVESDELKAVTNPLSIAASENDWIFPTEKRRESEDILKKLSESKGLPYEITLYSGVEHGFAVRGDLSKKQVKFAKERAFMQAVHWFDHHLLGKSLN